MKKIKFTTTGDNGKTTISLNYRDMGVKFSAHTRVRLVGKSWIEIKISGFSDIPNIFMTEDQFREYKDHEYYSEISDFLEEAKEKHAKIALFYQLRISDERMEMERELKLHPLFPKAEVTDVSRTPSASMECHNTMKRKMEPKLHKLLYPEIYWDTVQNQCESIPKTENNSSSEPVFKSTETLNSVCPESEPNGEHAKVQTVRDFVPGKVYVFEVHFDDIGFDKDVIKSLTFQLITGSIVLPKESKLDVDKWMKTMESIFDKRFIANVIERNNEKISLENYEDICDNIILLFNDKTFSLENIETKVKELLLRNTIFNVSDVLDSIIVMFKSRGFTYGEELSL